jgi:hypothetical protein
MLDRQGGAVGLHGVDEIGQFHLIGLCVALQTEVDGFLTQNRLARARRLLQKIGMGIRGAGNDHGIDLGICKRTLDGTGLRLVLPRQCLRGLAVDIDHQ